MAQQVFLILVLAFFAVTRADIMLTGQPSKCEETKPIHGLKPLLNYTQLTIKRGGKEFSGSLEILKEISTLQVNVTYSTFQNTDKIAEYTSVPREICLSLEDLTPEDILEASMDPESYVLDRIMEESPSVGCVPPIQEKTYNLNDVRINQENLQGLSEKYTYTIEIALKTKTAYSCIRLQGKGAPNTL